MNYQKPKFEISDIIREHRKRLEESGKLNSHSKKVFTNLSQCRTQVLGYHIDKCGDSACQHIKISYNSCRDRHCPKCNGIKREKWVFERQEDLLPVKYFHTVFTIPEQLNSLFIAHPKTMYNLLFSSAWKTITRFSLDHKHLGAKTGMVSILHTWGQNLAFHPHLHCIIAGGGLGNKGKWKTTKANGKFLYPVKALSKVFRGIFTEGLIHLDEKHEITLDTKFDKNRKYLHPFYKDKWVVYSKQPLHNAKQVLDYIGRYTHRIAISNHRIKSVEKSQVSFSWFNYKTSKHGTLTLKTDEFLRRFSMHILPRGFMKIRHYGILSGKNKNDALKTARLYLGSQAPKSRKGLPWEELFVIIYGKAPDLCPKCKKAKMKRILSVSSNKTRGSPPVQMEPNLNFYNQ